MKDINIHDYNWEIPYTMETASNDIKQLLYGPNLSIFPCNCTKFNTILLWMGQLTHPLNKYEDIPLSVTAFKRIILLFSEPNQYKL